MTWQYIKLTANLQNVADDSNTPHVGLESDRVVINHFRCDELGRSKHHLVMTTETSIDEMGAEADVTD